MTSALLEGLNPSQREAVTHVEGPLLVLAGPGSGKTRVITHRIAYLSEVAGVEPENILALTFTNKAAEEMRHRLESLVPGRSVWASTFHRLATRLLRRYASEVGLGPSFTILEPADVEKHVRDVLVALGHDTNHFVPDKFADRISDLKGKLVSADDFSDQATQHVDRIVAEVYRELTDLFRRNNAVDFDDLLVHLATLLKTRPVIREELDQRFRFVLIDEYQDTNLAQYAIARALSVTHPNLCATGDPDQSIYSWRGADLSNILNFESDFPGAKVVRLEHNYRSTGSILAVADALISRNVRRKDKRLHTENPEGVPVAVVRHQDDSSEARAIADVIRDAVDNGRREYRDFAVLLRTSGLFRAFEQTFKSRFIPYQVIGGYSFFNRKEVRDLFAYVRFLQNPSDAAAFETVVSIPLRGVGGVSLARLRQYALDHRLTLLDACRNAERIVGIKKKQVAAFHELAHMWEILSPCLHQPAADGLERICDESGYTDYLAARREEDASDRSVDVVRNLIEAAQSFSHERGWLVDFLDAMSLVSDSDQRDDSKNVVTVMTLHAAKGLEFPVVFLAAFEHKIIPHARAGDDRDDEEERRLAFVGMTRAREELTISYASHRFFQGRHHVATASPFLVGLPTEFIDRKDVIPIASTARMEPDDVSQESGYEEPSIQISRRGNRPSRSDGFYLGMRVRHAEFGDGTILQLEGTGDDRKATIEFSTIGPRRIVLAHAPVVPSNS